MMENDRAPRHSRPTRRRRSYARPTSWRALLLALTALWIPESATAQSPDLGRAAYEVRCAGCHGSDGAGGGHGPAIVDLRQPRATTPAAVRDLIRTGSSAGMPAFALPDTEIDAIAAFVDVLRSPAADRPAPGDAGRGEQYFMGPGGCTSCHRVQGLGGGPGPDLTNLARERKLLQIEQALRRPGSASVLLPGGRGGASPYRAVSAVLVDGRTIRGLAKYETLFDLGIHGQDERFHSVAKRDVQTLTWEPSIMPPVTVDGAEFQNLLAYLTRLTRDRPLLPPPAVAPAGGPEGVPFSAIARPRAGEWPTYNGQLGGNRHSPLADITVGNVRDLAPKWTFPIPGQAQRSLQVTPVVVDGLMYVTAVNEVWALDARTGREVWHYAQPRTPGLVGDPAAGINRGVAVLGARVFFQTDHAHLVALDRLTGQRLWDVEMADYRQHYGSTGAPLAVEDLVIAGVSGGDEGIRGFLDAYRASTGERVWRFWTVPAPGEPGSETWGGRAIAHGCAATWLTGTYDPEARLLYWPTGNPCPDYNGGERRGDNLYSNSVVALDPATGGLRWHFQFTPHDLNDWDATETPVLVDAAFRGQPRKLLLHGNRNGFFYVLDRLTGEFLLGRPFIRNLTWATGLDARGRPILAPDQAPTPEGTRTCPAVTGATNWPSPAYNPDTGLFYLMAAESCSIFTKNDQWFEQGQSFYGGGTRRSPGDVNTKFVRAINVETGELAWEIAGLTGGVIASGLMTTAGGLVFFGDASGGAFVAADARSGELVWHFDTGLGWKAGPMSYSVNGRQHIAIMAGATVTVFGLP